MITDFPRDFKILYNEKEWVYLAEMTSGVSGDVALYMFGTLLEGHDDAYFAQYFSEVSVYKYRTHWLEQELINAQQKNPDPQIPGFWVYAEGDECNDYRMLYQPKISTHKPSFDEYEWIARYEFRGGKWAVDGDD